MKGTYPQVVSDLCGFFNEREMSAQEMFAAWTWFMTQYFDPAEGARYARMVAYGFELEARINQAAANNRKARQRRKKPA